MKRHCQKIQEQLADGGAGLLDENEEIRDHVSGCADCSAFFEALQEVDAGLRTMPPVDAPDEAVGAALTAAREERAPEPAPPKPVRSRWFKPGLLWAGLRQGLHVAAPAVAACILLLIVFGTIGGRTLFKGMAMESSAAPVSTMGGVMAPQVLQQADGQQAFSLDPSIQQQVMPQQARGYLYRPGKVAADKGAELAKSKEMDAFGDSVDAEKGEGGYDRSHWFSSSVFSQKRAIPQPMPQAVPQDDARQTGIAGSKQQIQGGETQKFGTFTQWPDGDASGAGERNEAALRETEEQEATADLSNVQHYLGIQAPREEAYDEKKDYREPPPPAEIQAREEARRRAKAEALGRREVEERRRRQAHANQDRPQRLLEPSDQGEIRVDVVRPRRDGLETRETAIRSAIRDSSIRRLPLRNNRIQDQITLPDVAASSPRGSSPDEPMSQQDLTVNAFLDDRNQTDDLQFKQAAGYWLNTYVPGEPAMRLLESRLLSRGTNAFQRADGTPVPLDEAAAKYRQPFDPPENSALAVYLHSEKVSLEGPTRMLVQVGLQAGLRQSGRRSTMNIGLVLDMREEPSMEVGASIRALVSAFAAARQPGDRFSLTVAGRRGGMMIQPGDFRYGPVTIALRNLFGGGRWISSRPWASPWTPSPSRTIPPPPSVPAWWSLSPPPPWGTTWSPCPRWPTTAPWAGCPSV